MKKPLDRKTASPSQNETFIRLIRIAGEDPAFRKRLVSILSLPPFHRQSLINTVLEEMRLQGEPSRHREAFACLLDDGVAEQTKKMLDDLA
jgi:hypothetical protein